MRFLAALPWWALLLLLLGGALGASALDVGFLSDDYLMVAYWDRDHGAVQWPRVLADWQGPWFGVRDLYRPMVTLSCALQLAVHGFAPRCFHLANVAMVTTAALAIAALVRLRFPQGRGALALAAGALLLAHPAVVEPSHWVMARTAALEVMFGALAMLAYGAFLYGRLRSRWPAFVATALALASREGAMLLPISLVVVDLWCARGSLAARVQGLRPFFVLLAGYLLFRKLKLGVFTTMGEPSPPAQLAAGLVAHAGWLLGPPGAGRWVVAALLLVLLAPALRRNAWRTAAFAAWLLVLLVPTSHMPGTFDGRLVYQLVPALAVVLVDASAAHRRAVTAAAVLLALIAVLAAGTLPLAQEYRTGGASVGAMRTALAGAAASAAPGRPIAPIAAVLQPVARALLQSKLWGPSVQRPFSAADAAIAGLDVLLPHDLRANDTAPAADFVDGSPAHAVLAAGGALVNWTGAALQVTRSPAAAPLPDLVPLPGRPGSFHIGAPWLTFAGAVVEVATPAPASTCALRLQPDLAGVIAFGERRAVVEPAASTFWFDLSCSIAPLVQAGTGGAPAELAVAVDRVPAPAGTIVRLHAGPAPLPMARLAGADCALEDLPVRLPIPTGGATLYLLLPTTVVAVPHADGAPLQLTDTAQRELEFARRLLGHVLVHSFWRRDGGARMPERSALDWFVLR